MLEVLDRFYRSSVLVVGDVMLDTYWHGVTNRISPEAPVPVVAIENQEERLGGAANVALNVSVLGARATLLGLIGFDFAGEQIESLLRKGGVESRLQRVNAGKTISKLRVLSKHQQLLRLDVEDYFPEWDEEAFRSEFKFSLEKADVVVLSDYAKGTLRLASQLISDARAAGKKVVVDPKGTDFERYRGATLITPNLSEFETVVGVCASEAEIERKGTDLREHLELDAVLITRSEKGMTLLAKGLEPLHLPTQARDVYDVTGAGDTVVATIATALGMGVSIGEAVTLANVAAGVTVAKLGTATVSLQELKHSVQSSSIGSNQRICTESDLLNKINFAKRNGERVVMTNGCFDLLHPGHIDYLENARALGDRLIVAVNSDASIRRLKGSSRPINPLDTRLKMLSALACVDWVVSFEEDTPERLYQIMLPDVLVKGGDYKEEEVIGGSSVKAAGGTVEILSFLAGFSTTELIEKIQVL